MADPVQKQDPVVRTLAPLLDAGMVIYNVVMLSQTSSDLGIGVYIAGFAVYVVRFLWTLGFSVITPRGRAAFIQGRHLPIMLASASLAVLWSMALTDHGWGRYRTYPGERFSPVLHILGLSIGMVMVLISSQTSWVTNEGNKNTYFSAPYAESERAPLRGDRKLEMRW